MTKKLTKPYAKNVRLDKPCGLIGVPPDTPIVGVNHNVVLVAKLTDSQYTALIEAIRPRDSHIAQ